MAADVFNKIARKAVTAANKRKKEALAKAAAADDLHRTTRAGRLTTQATLQAKKVAGKAAKGVILKAGSAALIGAAVGVGVHHAMKHFKKKDIALSNDPWGLELSIGGRVKSAGKAIGHAGLTTNGVHGTWGLIKGTIKGVKTVGSNISQGNVGSAALHTAGLPVHAAIGGFKGQWHGVKKVVAHGKDAIYGTTHHGRKNPMMLS